MENNKQTAVQWLIHNIVEDQTIKAKSMSEWIDIFKKAKEIEKQQIMDSFGVGCQVESTRLIGYHEMSEQYYNKTYGGNNGK
jgi:hypothetical protein